MKIDNVEYEDVYRIVKYNIHDPLYTSCFICQKEFNENEKYFQEGDIYSQENIDNDDAVYYPICKKCGKTPRNAEKIIIPLLKIMYGGVVQISRFSVSGYKDFYY